MPSGVFLTARWHWLLVLNYEVPAAWLAPRVPAGLELDLWHGRALISLVGFRFDRLRVLGWPVLGHQAFPEINLRFYVRRVVGSEVHRGVVFLRELVPRRLITAAARGIYGEPYRTWPIAAQTPATAAAAQAGQTVAYRLGGSPAAGQFSARVAGHWQPLAGDSEEEFILEHYWGYTAQCGRLAEYQVCHPRWQTAQVDAVTMSLDVARLYGHDLLGPLSEPPVSALLANGSDVEVHWGRAV